MKHTRNRQPITNPHILELIDECLKITEQAGYEIKPAITFKQCKCVKRAGLASHDLRMVALSTFIYDEDDEFIKKTILHEIGHILVGRGHGHDALWQRTVNKLGNVIGVSISRCYAWNDIPNHKAVIANSYKYNFVCKGCGCQLHYLKRTKFVKTYDQILSNGKPRWTCTRCGNSFKLVEQN